MHAPRRKRRRLSAAADDSDDDDGDDDDYDEYVNANDDDKKEYHMRSENGRKPFAPFGVAKRRANEERQRGDYGDDGMEQHGPEDPPMEPFNLEREEELGRFDSEGNFIWNRKGKEGDREERPGWEAEVVSEEHLAKIKEREAAALEKAKSRSMDNRKALEIVTRILEPSESVEEALKRLGGTSGSITGSGNSSQQAKTKKKMSAWQRRRMAKKKKKKKTGESDYSVEGMKEEVAQKGAGSTGAQGSKHATDFDDLTAASSFLLTEGMENTFTAPREIFLRLQRRAASTTKASNPFI